MSVAVASSNNLSDRGTIGYYMREEDDKTNIEEEKRSNNNSDDSNQSFSEMMKMTREPGISMFEKTGGTGSMKKNPFTSGLRKLK